MGKMTKAQLRQVYQRWAREEIEAIELLEATGRFLDGADAPASQSPPSGDEGEVDELLGRLRAFRSITPDYPSGGSFLNRHARALIGEAVDRLSALLRRATTAERERDEAQAEVERLKSALTPFAAIADMVWTQGQPDGAGVTIYLLSCREARAALNKEQP